MGGAQAYNRVTHDLSQLPSNTDVTQLVCDRTHWSGILILDGKYIGVRGYNQKIPFLYGIDYLTHDIPAGDLYAAEDESSFSRYFQILKDLDYPLTIVVADDRAGLKNALLKVFPHAKLQLCHNHYLENIRTTLKVRTQDTYQCFFNSLRLHVFLEGTDEQTVTQGLVHVFRKHTKEKRLLENIVTTVAARSDDLFSCLKVPGCPNNTNLIELYNSHLNGRLKTIKGFQSLQSAKQWLNAYLIRRRTKKLTDCEPKFKYLNKHASLELTIKKQAQWPDILKSLGIPQPKFFQNSDKKH